jgi:hypothetical protein
MASFSGTKLSSVVFSIFLLRYSFTLLNRLMTSFAVFASGRTTSSESELSSSSSSSAAVGAGELPDIFSIVSKSSKSSSKG